MGVKATLKVVLMAGENVVAESEDPHLWQEVLARVYGQEDEGELPSHRPASPRGGPAGTTSGACDSALRKLAQSLDLTPEELEGACRPTQEAPYVTIDLHCWEAYRRGTPARGRRALGGTAVVGTLLALWAREADLPDPVLGHAGKVLSTLGAREGNPRRTVRNCGWLQLHGDRIKLNPAKVSDAKRIARAFVLGDWSDYSRTEATEVRS